MADPLRTGKDHDAEVDSHEQPFLDHLIELRARILRSVLAVVLLFFMPSSPRRCWPSCHRAT
jgi:Sec-independent protein secretion pathway component TatC